MEIKNLFLLGDTVYAITDPAQMKGLVVRIAKSWNGGVEYEVVFDMVKGWYQAIELSKEIGDKQITIQDVNNDDDDE
jgi:hypothetical protein